MKKKIIAFMILMVFCLSPAYAALKPNVVVSGFKADAIVGKDFTLFLTLKNTEPAACAQAITTSIQANSPFIMDGVSTLPAGDLCINSSKVVEFPMKVDPTAEGGTYQITVTNSFETVTLAQFSTSDILNIFVGGSPDIKANIIDSDPIDVYPGNTATLTVNIENAGDFEAQSLNAALSADEPIEVKWANSLATIPSLAARQSKTVDFTVEVPKNAEAKDYPLKLDIQFKDEHLTLKKKSFALMLHVKEKAMFETKDTGSEKLYANQNSKVIRLSVKNTGTDTAYKIKAKVLPQFPFSTDGSVRYIESLAPSQSSDIELSINIDKDGTPGMYGLDMLFDYEDAQGKKLQDTEKVVLEVQNKGFFRKVFIDYWFLWLAAVLIAIMVARKRMAKKKK